MGSAASWSALGTTVDLRVAGGDARAARSAAEDVLASVDLACSRFRDDSELSALNARAGRRTTVSPLLARTIAAALRAAEQTDGAADPTIGEALVRAGYDRDFALLEPAGGVAEGRVIRLRRRGAWEAIEFDAARRTVRVPAGVTLDLGASAKALAADLGARAAADAAGAGALFCVGGDIACAGQAPPAGWQVHVTDDHRDGPHAPGQRITVAGGAIATSSTVARRWSHQGRAMHHIIDPATGAPAVSPWRTATVAAADCVDANAASTAAIVKGDLAPVWLESLGMPARLVARNGRVHVLAGWPAGGEAGAQAA
ncbi:MAG TPA: FAD:protein FMN transferase [Solirubrobacteraceae bacterium]|nr:FAD:protein FMN transferase [Solirubrobacteraceae bacterium]